MRKAARTVAKTTTGVNLDADVLLALRERSRAERLPVSRLVNRVLADFLLGDRKS
jgi:hypothetical protein